MEPGAEAGAAAAGAGEAPGAASPALLARRWRALPGFDHEAAAGRLLHGEGGSSSSVDASHFRVLSFNILADSKQSEEKWSSEMPPGTLDWEARRWRLLREISRHSPDVVCLQELDHVDDFFRPELAALGYEGVVQPQPAPARDSSAVFFRTERFQLLRACGSLGAYGAAAALLEDLQCGLEDKGCKRRRLLVASAHFKSGKDRASEEARAAQAAGLLQELQKLQRHRATATTTAAAPAEDADADAAEDADANADADADADAAAAVVLAGDLNATPCRVEHAGEPLAYRTVVEHSLGLRSAYALWRPPSPAAAAAEPPAPAGEAPYTTWKRRPQKGEIKRTIDYVFFGPGLATTRLLDPVPEAEMPEERLPTLAYPSDHIAIGADLLFTEPTDSTELARRSA